MDKCPKCGCYMQWKMSYVCGIPFMYYECVCGYNTKEEESKTYTDNKTK